MPLEQKPEYHQSYPSVPLYDCCFNIQKWSPIRTSIAFFQRMVQSLLNLLRS